MQQEAPGSNNVSAPPPRAIPGTPLRRHANGSYFVRVRSAHGRADYRYFGTNPEAAREKFEQHRPGLDVIEPKTADAVHPSGPAAPTPPAAGRIRLAAGGWQVQALQLVPIAVTRSQLDAAVGADVTRAALAREGEWIDAEFLHPMPQAVAFVLLMRLQRLLVNVEMGFELHRIELGDIRRALNDGFDAVLGRMTDETAPKPNRARREVVAHV